jgi:hypothetical protein
MTRTNWSTLAPKQRAPALAVAALGLAFFCGCGGAERAAAEEPATRGAALTAEGRDAPNDALFDLESHPYGQSMLFWAEQWWRWVYSTPAAINPFLHPTLDSNQNQSGPVLFLVPGNRTNTVPRHTAIAVTTSALLNDFPCPDPTFQPPPGQSLFDFLLAGIKPVNDAVTEIGATLDGQAFTDLLTFRFISNDLTSVTGDLSLQASFDSCITGSAQPAVVDSFLFIIKPLEPGRHVLTTRVVNQKGEVFTHVQNLDVQ